MALTVTTPDLGPDLCKGAKLAEQTHKDAFVSLLLAGM